MLCASAGGEERRLKRREGISETEMMELSRWKGEEVYLGCLFP